MVKYFRDFCEFHNDHEKFCHKIFMTAAYSTGPDTSKSRRSRPQKFGAIRYTGHCQQRLCHVIILSQRHEKD